MDRQSYQSGLGISIAYAHGDAAGQSDPRDGPLTDGHLEHEVGVNHQALQVRSPLAVPRSRAGDQCQRGWAALGKESVGGGIVWHHGRRVHDKLRLCAILAKDHDLIADFHLAEPPEYGWAVVPVEMTVHHRVTGVPR